MMNVSDTRDCAFEAFITNLGKYNEGFLVGEWVKFPVTNEEMQAVFRRTAVDALRLPDVRIAPSGINPCDDLRGIYKIL